MQLLDADEVTRRLPIRSAIAVARATFEAMAAGIVHAPDRTFQELPPLGEGAWIASMPAHVGGDVNVLAEKIVTIVPSNAGRGLPTIHALITVFDGTTGEPLGVVEGTTVTTLRTAAVSAVATDALAPLGAQTLAVLGTGVQGRAHVAAIRAIRDIEHVSLWNRTKETAEALARDLRADGLWATVADEPAQAVEDAEIVCTCTASPEPLLHAADVTPGTHINAVGAFTPEMAELGADLVEAAWVAVDTRRGAWAEAGDLIRPLKEGLILREHVQANLAELVTGHTEPPGEGVTTVFKSVGHAAEDALTARFLLEVVTS